MAAVAVVVVVVVEVFVGVVVGGEMVLVGVVVMEKIDD